MSSPLENKFQKTSLGKDQTPYLACKKPGREATSGTGDHKEMPEVRTAIWVSWSKDRDRTQATCRPFQVVLNLLLKTALKSELLSFQRQFALCMAIDQKTSSFSAAFCMKERMLFLPRIYKTQCEEETEAVVKNRCRNLCGSLTFLPPSLPQLVTTLLLMGTPPQQRWQKHLCFKASPLSQLKQTSSIL